ncbi:MAG: type II toxin-antitoxin system VapC family toxin [Thermoanaerobaculia bacterium]
MVVDTSALLAILFDEPHATWCAERMAESAGDVVMSTVNLAETLILTADRRPGALRDVEEQIVSSGAIRFVPPDAAQARAAAAARLRFPLNLGDCFAYALAVAEKTPILTLDRDFLATGHPLLIPKPSPRRPRSRRA